MRFESEILGLPSGTETLLRELVHERTGIFFEPGKVDLLMDKLAPLVVKRGFNSFLDYYYLLKYDESSAEEWRNVMNAISVGETYFWREIDQIRALAGSTGALTLRVGTGHACESLSGSSHTRNHHAPAVWRIGRSLGACFQPGNCWGHKRCGH